MTTSLLLILVFGTTGAAIKCSCKNNHVEREGKHVCPVGSFACGDDPTCVPQQQQCDNVTHCPNGFDEAIETCHHFHDVLAFTLIAQGSNAANTSDIGDVPPMCKKESTAKVNCISAQLSSLPPHLPHRVIFLKLQNNSLSQLLMSAQLSNFSHLRTLYLDHNNISEIKPEAFEGLHELRKLSLADNRIERLETAVFQELTQLTRLVLLNNKLHSLESGSFLGLNNLQSLDLTQNELSDLKDTQLPKSLVLLDLRENFLTHVHRSTFNNSPELLILYLQKNRIERIDEDSFRDLRFLEELDLSFNRIVDFPRTLFEHNDHVVSLFLEHNPVHDLGECFFSSMPRLRTLNISGITLSNLHVDMFACSAQLSIIAFERFSYCKYAPLVRTCYPKGDGLSSVGELIDNCVLRVVIWLVGVLTISLNCVVVIGRVCFQGENPAHSLVIKNLAVADFLMGVYLLAVACKDSELRAVFNQFALSWMQSGACAVLGVVAVASSEVSIFILTYLSLERYVMLVHPYKNCHVSLPAAALSMACLWLGGLLLAVLPLLGLAPSFYASNAVCFPLHLHHVYADGWQYSTAMFVCLNGACLVVICFCYVSIFRSIQQTRRETADCVHGAARTSFAQRFFLIVLTDAMCWAPIMFMKLLALANITISDSAYAWLAVLVLPINSALNPLLYSLSTQAFKKRMSALASRIRVSALNFSRSSQCAILSLSSLSLGISSAVSRRSSSTSGIRSTSLAAVVVDDVIGNEAYSPTFTHSSDDDEGKEDVSGGDVKKTGLINTLCSLMLRR